VGGDTALSRPKRVPDISVTTIIKKKKATEIFLGYAKTYRDKAYPKPHWTLYNAIT